MSKEKHILFNMDQTLSDSLDHMIVETSRKAVYGVYRQDLNDMIGRTSWRENLTKICNTFKRLANPDAAEIVPVFKKVFDEKKAMVESLEIAQEIKDSILFALSVQRKRMGIDNRNYKKSDDPSTQRLEIAH